MRAATVDTTGRRTVDTAGLRRGIRDVPRKEATVVVLSSAELAECTCPDLCDRDHDRD
jgi:hypothetical protein